MNDNFSFDLGLARIIIFSLFPIGIDCFKNKQVNAYIKSRFILYYIIGFLLLISIWFIGNEFIQCGYL